jgi:hypothetical protein
MMDKKELIDKAVKELKGKWIDETGEENHLYRFYGGRLVTGVYSTTPSTPEYVCNKEEFQQRARELGWINGYQFGVEYPTNGKKPDLPDDLLLLIKCEKGSNTWHSQPVKSLDVVWSNDFTEIPASHFKIIDERYKPVEYEPVKITSTFEGSGQPGGMGSPTPHGVLTFVEGWYDYENQRAIKLPPIDGNECEYYDSDHGWQSCKVLMHYLDGVIIDGVEGVRFSIYTFRPKDHATRKADIERKRVVGAVYTIIDQHEGTILESVFDLYDKGYLRMPEDK